MIRRHMDATRSDMARKIEALENQVLATVHDTTAAVTDTVASVKEAVHETVESVKETFDIRHQVERHPWAMFGAAVAAGFAGGRLFGGGRRAQADRITGLYSEGAAFTSHAAATNGTPDRSALDRSALEADAARAAFTATPAHTSGERSWLDDLRARFTPEIDKLKGVAVGAVGALVRDLVNQSAPPSLQSQLAGLVDDVTRKLGGEPVRGSLFQTGASGDTSAGKTSRDRDAASEARRDRAAYNI
jgi:hypothetical protein